MKAALLSLLLVCSASAATVSICQNEVIAATLVLEAGGESNDNGMVAVYEVIRNRAKLGNKTQMEVCLARKQFSCWNGVTDVAKVIAKAKRHKKWNDAVFVVNHAYKTDWTKGATSYHSNKMSVFPSWAKKMTCVGSIGNHIFYK